MFSRAAELPTNPSRSSPGRFAVLLVQRGQGDNQLHILEHPGLRRFPGAFVGLGKPSQDLLAHFRRREGGSFHALTLQVGMTQRRRTRVPYSPAAVAAASSFVNPVSGFALISSAKDSIRRIRVMAPYRASACACVFSSSRQ